MLRLARILPKNNKTVIVPIDHGIEGYYPELEDQRRLVREFIDGGADAILLRRGTLMKVADLIAGRAGVILRVSGATSTSKDLGDQRLISSVRESLLYGADAIVFTLMIGHAKENDMLTLFGNLVDEADEKGLPVIGEVDVWEKASGDRFELIRQGVRVLSEEGASLIKAYFPNERERYKDIIKYSLVPVVAAGGPKLDDPIRVLTFVKDVIEAGAVGTCIGRNIWQYKEPRKMIKAISIIIKDNKGVEEASKAL